MTDKPNMKEVRGYIRATVQRLEAFKVLDEQLGDAADLTAFIAQQKRESESLEKQNGAARDAVAEALAMAEQTRATAQAQAQEVIGHAEKVRQDAEQRALSVDAIVADARSEADRLIGEGRRIGEQLASELEGRITMLRKDVAELDTKRTTLGNDIAALEKRKQAVKAEIDKLAKSLAETA